MKSRSLLCACLTLLILASLTPAAFAQDPRGGITGRITDSSGGVLPGVTVTVTNVETNVPAVTVTDKGGFYQALHLNTGMYTVEAKLDGFKPVQRQGVSVRVGDLLKIDLALQPGGIEEVMVVTAAAPVLDTTTGNTGQVIEAQQIQQLPLGDGTAYMLTRLAPGIMDSSDLHFSRPADNGNLAGITANGAQGGNDFTLDGAPNRVSPNNTNPGNNNGVVGFSPPSDSIAAFKVLTNAFDASAGHTAGATVNLTLKSGSNELKGSAGYFNRSDSRSATPLLTKRAGAEKPTREYDRFTMTVGGPILRDRTFFMASVERLKDIQPEPSTFTVPTEKMRNGDLSEFGLAIYDPLTATGSNGTRQPFAGNQIPQGRINPVARAYANLYPLPNRPGTTLNYFTNMLRPYDYNAALIRLDHSITSSNNLFLNGYYNKREEDRYNWAKGAANATGEGEINGFEVTHGFDYRSNTGATLGYTSTFSSNLLFNAVAGWSRFGEWRKPADEIDPATLGFSPAAAALMDGYNYLPFITFGGFSSTNANSRLASLGSQRSDFGIGFNRPFTNLSFTPTGDYLLGNHSLRAGYDLRHQKWKISAPPYGAGRYHFNGAYTRANNSAATNEVPQSWAQFLLGLPTTGTNSVATVGSTASQFEIAAEAEYTQVSHALFVQDDWRVTDRLTLNLGARLELDMAMREAEDRNVAGFDPTIDNPIEAAALANYTKSPIAQIPVAQFQVNGGLQFADGALYNDLHKFLPRAALSFQLDPKTVIRGGAGLFSYTYYFDAGNQTGFSQPTAINTTENNGATFLTDLTNPIPSGTLIQPVGSTLGARTGLGLNLGTIVPSEREAPYYTRFQLGAQRDLGAGWVAEIFFVSSRGSHLPVQREINGIPMQYLSTSRLRDTTQEAFLSANVPSPFAGMLPGSNINGANVQRGQLLRPFPQFQSIIVEEYRGSDSYKAGALRVEKRFRGGNSLVASYTRSRTEDKLNFLNPQDGILEERISPNDRPHRATFGATLALPFGEGRRWGTDWSPFMKGIFGGWTVSATYQYQTGFPLLWTTNIYYDPTRDPRDLRGHIGGNCPGGGTAGLDCAAWDISGFQSATGNIQLGNNVRYFPSTLPHVRTDDLHLMDVGFYKNFPMMRDINLQFRVEVINALNYTVLWNPNLDPRNANFGKVNQDRNNPRDVQLAAKLTF
jgi:Carboxypeptidase regulatory-like domain/TonB dependent receptor